MNMPMTSLDTRNVCSLSGQTLPTHGQTRLSRDELFTLFAASTWLFTCEAHARQAAVPAAEVRLARHVVAAVRARWSDSGSG
ncbi:MAG: hypothetical protein JWP52_2542 [Rhizobacter sp.]|nr:hypothetical protein [Rhizobacter sp.]